MSDRSGTMHGTPSRWSRRNVFRLSGGVAGAALLSGYPADAATARAVQSRQAAPAQQGTGMAGAEEARFAYTGSYTRGAPGGWSALASANHPVGVSVFAVGAGMGDLQHIQTVPSDNPSFVAIHPSGATLYVVNEVADYEGEAAGSVEAYAIDDASGELTLLNRVACASIPAHLAVDPTGSYLALATYVGATYELFTIQADGSLAEGQDVVQEEGSGPHDRQQSPHPHCVVFDPAGNFIAGIDLGTDWIKIFQIDDGALVQVSQAMVEPGSGPRHAAFHPNGSMLYVINELTGTIVAFAYDSETGALGEIMQTIGTVPQSFPAHKSTAEIMVHSSGNFLYGSNRKFEDHALADSIVAYHIDPGSGLLRMVGFTTDGIGFPRGFNLDPTGSWLYALGQKNDSIVQFMIDPGSGALTSTGLVTQIPVPVSIVFKT